MLMAMQKRKCSVCGKMKEILITELPLYQDSDWNCQSCEAEIGEGFDEFEIKSIAKRRGRKWINNKLKGREKVIK